MSDSCTHNCESCSSNCSSREAESMLVPLGEGSSVKKVYAVVSGKGGVGKSLVTALMAVNMQRKGHQAAILDADITGPSVPRMFGIKNKAAAGAFGLLPCRSSSGVEVMSINLLLENESDPVIWRGPVLSGIIQQDILDDLIVFTLCTGEKGERGKRQQGNDQQQTDKAHPMSHLSVSPSISLPVTVIWRGTWFSGSEMASIIIREASWAIRAVSWR